MSRVTSNLILLAIWAATAAYLLVQGWDLITTMYFRDPDDALRLVQTRDLLAGQSWFDVTQYRINPPQGVPMHWSRLVDAPLALGMLALRPLFGVDLGDRIVLAGIPLLYLLGLCLVLHALCRRLALSQGTALLAVALLASSVTILIQFTPMRIDHHGAQVLCGALAMLGLIGTQRRDGLMGLMAGIAAGGWMQISMEGLPYTVAIGGVYALRFLWSADNWPDLRAYLPALTVGSALMLLGTHGWQGSLVFWCDAMSPTYLLPLTAVSAMLLLAGRVVTQGTYIRRLVPLALAGLAGIAVYLAVSRQCLGGPFASLDPLVHQLWYEHVLEGMPIGRQKPDFQLFIIVPALLGLVGSIIALRRAGTENLGIAWASLLLLQLAALAIALNVMRAMTFAHFIALPGNAVLLVTLAGAAQRLTRISLRVPLTAAVVLLTPFGAVTTATALVDTIADKPKQAGERIGCVGTGRLRGLNALPRSTLFTPLDIGPHLLAYTPHAIIGTGHHRNLDGMKAVVHAFADKPADARSIITASGANYLAFCPGENEAFRFLRTRPAGLMATLMRGQRPDWLVPVRMRPGETIKVYRIVRASPQPQAAANFRATPFMQ